MSKQRKAKGADDRYLWRRPGSENWWLKITIPKDVRLPSESVLHVESLGTPDKALAKQERARRLASLYAEWDGRRGKHATNAAARTAIITPRTPSRFELEDAATKWGFDGFLTEKLDADRQSKRGVTNEEWERYLETRRVKIVARQRLLATGDLSPVENAADKLVAGYNWLLPKDSDGYRTFCAMLLEATLEALNVSSKRDQGQTDAQPTGGVVKRTKERAEQTAPAGERLLDLFDKYADMHRRQGTKREDTLTQDRKVIELFAEFVGADRRADTITKAEVRNFRDVISDLPPTFRKRSGYEKLSLRDAAAKAKAAGLEQRSAKTVNKYLSTLSPLFAWIIQNGYSDTSNPVDGLHYKLEKGSNRRPSFTADQLNAIFLSPLFTGYRCDGKEHEPGNIRLQDWRYWIPLICLFTGARVGEIAQLHVDDIRCEHNVWYIDIAEDEESGQQVKNKKSRIVPIHVKLIELGFLDFHATQAKRAENGGSQQLFAELTANSRNHMGAKPSRFWRDYLSDIGLKDGADGLGTHAFRHTMADELRKVGYRDHEFGPMILGHSNKTVTSGYGALPEGTLKMRDEMIQAVRFEGVRLDHLKPATLAEAA